MKRNLSSLVLFTVLLSFSARAHDVWLENTPDHQMLIHFGEFGDELETSPGYLDSLTLPQAWTAGTNGPAAFEIQKQTNSFALAQSADSKVTTAETGFEVLSATNKPSRLPLFYARWQPAGAGAGTPALTFDLVPQAKAGDIQVYFRDKVVVGETVNAHGPGGFEKDVKTDNEGRVHFDLDKPGLYLFTCNHHRETATGFSGGRHYDLVSHNASLTLRVPEANQ